MEAPAHQTTLLDMPDDVLGHIAGFLSDTDDKGADQEVPQHFQSFLQDLLQHSSSLNAKNNNSARESKHSFRQCCRTCYLSPALQPCTLTLNLEKGDNTALLESTHPPAALQHVKTLCIETDESMIESLEFFEAGEHNSNVRELLEQVTGLELKVSSKARDCMWCCMFLNCINFMHGESHSIAMGVHCTV